MNVADTLLLQQMQAMAANLPKTVNAVNTGKTGNSDPTGSFQDMMDQQNTAVDSGKDNAPAEQQPAKKDDAAQNTASDNTAKPVQKTEDTDEIDPNLAVYALDLFRPEIVDVSEPEVAAEMPVEIAPVEEAPAVMAETDVPLETAPAAEEAAPEIVTADVPAETADPVVKEEAPEIVPEDAPKAEAVQESVQPAETRKTETHTGQVQVEAPEETEEISDTGEIRAVKPEEKSEDTTSEDLSGELQQMEQPVFHNVETAPVKVADHYEPVDTQEPDMDEKLAVNIMEAVQNGVEQMQIRLNPANLGAITIDLTKDVNGALQVVIHASNSKAAGLLTEHLDTLHTALQSHGSQQNVHVEVQRTQEGQEQHMFQQADPDGKNQQHQQRQNEQHEEQESSGEDFLQKLRLGLTGSEE